MYQVDLLAQLAPPQLANVRIVTDSLADIPPAIIRELDITVVPAIVRFGAAEYRDRVDLPSWEFYQKLSNSPVLPTTSVPSIGDFEQTFRELGQATNQILAIHTIGTLSGIYNASRLAAQDIPNTQIEVLDSQQVSMSLGWLVIQAARAAKVGKTLGEIKALVESLMRHVHIVAMLGTLEYAQRGGRLGKGAALVGTLLNVKPLLSTAHGEIIPLENVRSQKRALSRLVELVVNSGPVEELAVVHAHAPELAIEVEEALSNVFPDKQIVLSETGPVLGAHAGPGAVGIAWLSKRNGKV
ncbi:MAG: DegV family protein [Chloroflexi bacterium]|nr:DegV family protein [Chloroflexota bacterium]